ncbi:Gag-Pol polyprotein [Dictyocoela muelleri]|nr:Gag-Pol polyprotein [Dictyocoela muelleri]
MPAKQYVNDHVEYENIVKILRNIEFPLDRKKKERLIKKSNLFKLINQHLYFKSQDLLFPDRLVIAKDDKHAMEFHVKNVHDQCHLGINKLEDLCNKKFFGIRRDIIRKIVSNCQICSLAQPLKYKDEVHHIIAKKPNERFQIDLIDLKSYSEENGGYKWILTVIDIYSRFGFVKALKNKTGTLVVAGLKDIFHEHGPCEILQSDNGTEFKNKDIQKLCEDLNIEQIHGRPNHPQSQGIVERFNQTITRFISKTLSPSDTKN